MDELHLSAHRKTARLSGRFSMVRLACKPNSVRGERRVRRTRPRAGDGHLSGTSIARRLKQATKFALAPERVFHGAHLWAVPRGLLPHVFNLTCARALRPWRLAPCGVQAVDFLLHFPWAWGIAPLSRIPRERAIPCSRPPLAALRFLCCQRGVRTFLTSGPCGPSARPSGQPPQEYSRIDKSVNAW